jgi:endonuclease/exonuclease/phosphatase family metal-dependent hydrolase
MSVRKLDSNNVERGSKAGGGNERGWGWFLFIPAWILLAFSGCRFPLGGGEETVSILSWNVQNIFDASDDGSEYPDFRSSSGWRVDDYRNRLTALAEVLSVAVKDGADIILLQEIENQRVLQDLNNDYLFSLGYRYLAASDQEGTAVQVGLLSRFPIRDVLSRTLSLPAAPPMRPILEVELELPGEIPLLILLCHWKSKAGGAEETELWRRAAANLVARRIQELSRKRPELPILVAGDLNEAWNEYELTERAYPTALFPWGEEYLEDEMGYRPLWVSGEPVELDGPGGGVALLYSPWAADSSLRGSYLYRGSWEKIDHLLFTEPFFDRRGVEFSTFEVFRGFPWSSDEGHPKGWSRSTGYGYSDHLPIGCILELGE